MDIDKIEQLIKLANESAISELTVRRNGVSVSIRKPHGETNLPAAATQVRGDGSGTEARPPEAVTEVSEAEKSIVVTAPMVGIFHATEEVVQGARVSSGQVLGAIESMKLMNDVTAPSDGVISEVFVEDGTPVEYGQPLYRIEH